MTESTDTITNYRQSGRHNEDNPTDLFVASIHQQEHAVDLFGLFDDDDDNLTLFDLKPIPESNHDLSIFDELAHQCNAVLHATNVQQKTPVSTSNNNSYSSNLNTTTMINDYERRFQRSLQKLTIPSWYIDTAPSPKISSKLSIDSTSHYSRESHRTPEIIHVHRPHSYRSCRSSVGTSPSPSMHSWHPNHMMDGLNFSSVLPSSSSTSRRHHHKYEKAINRVVKSSHWYQPIHFSFKTKTHSIGTSKISTIEKEKANDNHYDTPKCHYDTLSNSINQSLIVDNSIISGLSIQQESNYLIDDIDFDDVENTSVSKQNNNNTGNNSMTKDKHQENRIKSNEIQIMPLANEKMSFGRVKLEEVTDEEENDKQSSLNNIYIPSTVDGQIDDDEKNALLECLASNLVDTILNDILFLKNLDQDDDTNTGVRELSDDENALRELDENDMSGTDEFIVFATKANLSDDDNNNNDTQTPSNIPRGSLNRLYTFSRTNDDSTINPCKISSNQDASTSVLMIVDKDISTTHSLSDTDQNQSVNTMVSTDNEDFNNSFPLYRSHIQKRHINLGRYYDGMMRGTNSQLPTYDLRSNLFSNNANERISSESINEETVRKGRILLDSIPSPIELKNQLNENVPTQSIPARSILKNTRYVSSNETNGSITDGHILQIEEKEKISSRKIITTTITEEYRRIQRRVIEEFDEEPQEEKYRDSGYSSNQERLNTQQSSVPAVSINDSSPYELLSDCYSGYSFVRSDFLTPVKNPLTSNVSSLQSTTDEAYESEVTLSPRSPIMNLAATTKTAYVHPDLKHEFEYPSPPPPVPDRRLKPAHLRPPAPPTKPRTHIQQPQQRKDVNHYSKTKKTKASPLAVIQHLMASTPNDSPSSSTRTFSSRHYCGSIPSSNEPITSSSSNYQTKIKTDEVSQRNSKTPQSIISSTNDNNNQPVTFTKSSSTSLTKLKSKKPSSVYFDEATNGLPIRLPASEPDRHNPTNDKNLNRTSTPSSTKRADVTSKTRPISENFIMDRPSTYETSV